MDSYASYAVVWRDDRDAVCSGELSFEQASLRLDGALASGAHVILDVPYAEIRAVRIGRTPAERIGGSAPVLVTTSRGSDLSIVSAGGVGIVREIAERLDGIVATRAR